MQRALLLLIILMSSFLGSWAQKKSFRQPATVGIHFIFNDFATAEAIRSSSLTTALRENHFGIFRDMDQGLALSFGTGMSEHFDFSSMLAGAFLTYPFREGQRTGRQGVLFEADASVRGKMFTDQYWFVPYLQVGAGFSKFEGYWGAYIPAGVGIQINFFDEAYLIINSQYRIAVTESVNYHFVFGIGLVGNIGPKE